MEYKIKEWVKEDNFSHPRKSTDDLVEAKNWCDFYGSCGELWQDNTETGELKLIYTGLNKIRKSQ